MFLALRQAKGEAQTGSQEEAPVGAGAGAGEESGAES